MCRAYLHACLALLFILAPVAVTSALLARVFGAALLDCRTTFGAVSDELHYREEVQSFKEVGLAGGYSVVNERPAPARWSHFGPHGPAFPAFYGTLARAFGWRRTLRCHARGVGSAGGRSVRPYAGVPSGRGAGNRARKGDRR
jgi:hypothetical protein